jgi:hypothetical protein
MTLCIVEKKKAVLTLSGAIFVGIEDKFKCSC